MKKILVLCLVLLFLIGCQKAAEEQMEAKIEAETGADAEVDLGKGEMTIETDEGKVEVTGLEDSAGEWCQEGAKWKFTSSQPDMDASADWVIKGLMNSGEYAGLCHVLYTAKTPQGETTMDYYFSEDGKSGYFEINLPDGQTMKQEWHG